MLAACHSAGVLPFVRRPICQTVWGFNTSRPTFEPIRLHFAINQDNYEEAERQVKQDVDINFIIHGNTPLMLAILRHQYDIVMLLIRHGANVRIPEVYAWKRQPIHLAAMLNQVKVMDALLNHGASIQAADGMQMTPLHWACSYDALETAKLLLDRGAHLETRDDRGKTPLFRAAASNHGHIVGLLRSEGAAVNIQDIYGWSPLHHAVFCSLPVANQLLELNANPNLRDYRGNTVLHLMVQRGDDTNLAILARSDVQFYTRDRKSTTSCTQGVREFLDDKQLLYMLLDYNIDMDVINGHGFTAFDLAVRSGMHAFVRWFINAGAKISLVAWNYPHSWPPSLLDDQSLCELLLRKTTQPVQTLKELCKFSTRKYIYPVVTNNILVLPLPTQLKQYLLIDLDC
ncbi:hypothetical protein LSH36_1086g00020 [Paralvinella palmiformis]|uniref:SOCS box domain-containing protein n=1 Tax=Paralvinella palmiformis TaxID=53620 RepID=A0AAD9IVP0_9ANNE|nr:hypothetical protein LSH36_1086g00020 [Paralvinella palmiformis]